MGLRNFRVEARRPAVQGWLLLGLVLAAACGDDASSGGGDSDAGLADAGSEAEPADGDPGEGVHTSTMADCDDGEQDRDGDGVCSAACGADIDCGSGSCDDFTGTARCVCPDGVTGAACDSCAQGFAGSSCDACAAGFVAEGDGCVEDACAMQQCGEHGSCVQTGGDAHCECAPGFAGATCDTCAEGYEGAACDTCATGFELVAELGCVSNVCLGHDCGLYGSCVDEGGAPACDCDEGFAGATCDSCAIGYAASPTGACLLRPPFALDTDLVLWQDADDRSTLYFNDEGGVIAWRNKASADKYAFIFPGDSAQHLSDDGGRERIVFSGGDYATRTFSLPGGSYAIYIVTKWQSDAEAGGNAPSQGILAGVDLDGVLGHGLWFEARGDTEIRYRHRFPFGGGGAAVGDEVYGKLYDANQGLQVISAHRSAAGAGSMSLHNARDREELAPLTKFAFADSMRLHLGVNGPSGAGALEGEIAEILIYKAFHGNQNRSAVEDYLRTKWNVAPPSP